MCTVRVTCQSLMRKRPKKLKVSIADSQKNPVTAMECHLPYGITQSYLPPDTSEHALP